MVIRKDKKELRCECGNLLAKVTPEGIELKCKRCKRIEIIPFSQIEKLQDYPGQLFNNSDPEG